MTSTFWRNAWRYRAREGTIERLRSGNYRAQAAHLATYGNRGYRVAQLEAALYAGRLHLAAQALGLGAVGSTSFDDEVVEFFSPQAADASYMFIIVFGARRRRTPTG
jgi:nitroreductase